MGQGSSSNLNIGPDENFGILRPPEIYISQHTFNYFIDSYYDLINFRHINRRQVNRHNWREDS